MIRIGIICPSDIAYRRFLPALQEAEGFQFVGVAYASPNEWFAGKEYTEAEASAMTERESGKAAEMVASFGGKTFAGYETMLASKELDAVYLPLPPALHYAWAKKALEYGLHVFVEKPSTSSAVTTKELVTLASEKRLALHENYMFMYHSQLETIREAIASGAIGRVWKYSVQFGFPRRALTDFRYSKKMGGGALLDCGGYTLKLADALLGQKSKLLAASAVMGDFCDVDVYGTGLLTGEDGTTVEVTFGMDMDYRCSLDAWGSEGSLHTGRIMTAPAGLKTTYTVAKNGVVEATEMAPDNAFLKSIEVFRACVESDARREEEYQVLLHQSELVEEFREFAKIR